MEKLKASDVIEVDNDFVAAVAKKVAEITESNKKKEIKLYTIKELSKIVHREPNTLLIHVKNFITKENRKTQLEATKVGNTWLVSEQSLQNYLTQNK